MKPLLYRFADLRKFSPKWLHHYGTDSLALLVEEQPKPLFFEIFKRKVVEGHPSWINPDCVIDPEIQDLIIDLNLSGFRTVECCKGRYAADDGKHVPGAYVRFGWWLPNEVKRALKAQGVHIPPLMSESAIASSVGHTPLHERIDAFRGTSTAEDYAKNRAFESNVRAAFGDLLPKSSDEIYGLLQTA